MAGVSFAEEAKQPTKHVSWPSQSAATMHGGFHPHLRLLSSSVECLPLLSPLEPSHGPFGTHWRVFGDPVLVDWWTGGRSRSLTCSFLLSCHDHSLSFPRLVKTGRRCCCPRPAQPTCRLRRGCPFFHILSLRISGLCLRSQISGQQYRQKYGAIDSVGWTRRHRTLCCALLRLGANGEEMRRVLARPDLYGRRIPSLSLAWPGLAWPYAVVAQARMAANGGRLSWTTTTAATTQKPGALHRALALAFALRRPRAYAIPS